jgi:hypothetical protein
MGPSLPCLVDLFGKRFMLARRLKTVKDLQGWYSHLSSSALYGATFARGLREM